MENDNVKSNNVLGVLWGIALGILGAVAGLFFGFTFFGLVLFGDTEKAMSLIGLASFAGFLIVFVMAFRYSRKHWIMGWRSKVLAPVGFFMVEILLGLGVIYGLNVYTQQVPTSFEDVDTLVRNPTFLFERNSVFKDAWDSAENIAFGQVKVLDDLNTSGYYRGTAKVDDIYNPCSCPLGASCEPCAPGAPVQVTVLFEECYCGGGAQCKVCTTNRSKTLQMPMFNFGDKPLPEKDKYYFFLFEKSKIPLAVRVLDYESENIVK
ncbi:MAG: hypothetical protein WCT25_01775 [Candidatus Paceibacterota bacterium]|jgi:hypothetical protein